MSRLQRLGIYLLLLVPLAGVVDGFLELHRVARVPSMADWRAAAAVVRAGYKSGDIVHFRPYWADQGQFLFRGMDLDVVQMLDTNELSTYKRVWIVATMSGLPFEIPKGFQKVMEKKLHRIQVFLLKPDRGRRVVFDLLQGLASAKVTRLHPGRREVCRNFKNNRWYCGAVHPWQFVGERVRDLADGSPRRVIWAHPLDKGHKLEIQYPNVPVGDQLEIDYGWSLRAIESGQGRPVHFQVYVDNVLKKSLTLRKDNEKWNRLLIDLGRERKKHTLKLVIWTPDYHNRQFCIKGWIFDRSKR